MDEQKYVKEVGKRLHCSKEKRMEIEQQLASDIQAAMEHGESFEEILARMGTVKSVAEEFNANLKEEGVREKRSLAAWVMDNLGMVIVVVIVIAVCVTSGIAITKHFHDKKQNNGQTDGTKIAESKEKPDGSGQKDHEPAATEDPSSQPQITELSDEDGTFSKQEVQARVEQMVTFFYEENYEQMFENSTERLKEMLGQSDYAAVMQSGRQQISTDWGAFVSYGNAYMGKVVQDGQEFVVVQMNVSYEKISVSYTITLDAQLKLDGFYVR